MAGLNDVLWIVGSYIVIIILMYATLNFLTKGFIYNYLRVKMSRGKYTLIRCNDVTDVYYKAGKIDSKRNLILKDRFKKIHTFSGIEKIHLNRELGVNLIEVDLVKGLLIHRDYSGASAFDLTMFDEFVNRALMLPQLKKDNWELVQRFLLIAIFIGVVVCVYLLFTAPEPVFNMPLNGTINI
jgi:hypothetical protein